MTVEQLFLYNEVIFFFLNLYTFQISLLKHWVVVISAECTEAQIEAQFQQKLGSEDCTP